MNTAREMSLSELIQSLPRPVGAPEPTHRAAREYFELSSALVTIRGIVLNALALDAGEVSDTSTETLVQSLADMLSMAERRLERQQPDIHGSSPQGAAFTLTEANVEALRRGAHDYHGGHHDEPAHGAFHHGIDTAFNVLASMVREHQSGKHDAQNEAVRQIGGWSSPQGARDIPGLNPADVRRVLKLTTMTCARFAPSTHGNSAPKSTGELIRCQNCDDPQWKHWLRNSVIAVDDLLRNREGSSPQGARPTWQPISTAPKGGGAEDTRDPKWVEPPRILAVSPSRGLVITYWDWYYAEGGSGYRPNYSGWVNTEESRAFADSEAPTLWMPLPDPLLPVLPHERQEK